MLKLRAASLTGKQTNKRHFTATFRSQHKPIRRAQYAERSAKRSILLLTVAKCGATSTHHNLGFPATMTLLAGIDTSRMNTCPFSFCKTCSTPEMYYKSLDPWEPLVSNNPHIARVPLKALASLLKKGPQKEERITELDTQNWKG